MARAADHAGIHFRRLNASKGPAVRATRAQACRQLYKQTIRQYLESQPNLRLFQQGVDDLIVDNNRVIGVITQMGLRFYAKTVVLTVGTFLGGHIHIGKTHYPGGRAGDPPANALATRLRELAFNIDRLKTGTPPRIDGKTIDYSQLTVQPGDVPTPVFSVLSDVADHPQQVVCHITRTTEKTHEIIRSHLHESPMYSGDIQSVGPRYCPSIEDKVVRFADKESHQIFVEPEGLYTNEVYPNGISTSLPFSVQQAFVRSIIGFECAVITRAGYAIEYDFFDPRGLHPWLETKPLPGLFFAGQINGTTGYEEAAAQGLIAGINAARQAREQAPWYPRRDQAYIGVLIDDLITRGTQEPYRMFTSRAEYRLLLREDNADLRLTETGRELDLVGDQQWQAFCARRDAIDAETARLRTIWINPGDTADQALTNKLGQSLTKGVNALDLLRRPQLTYQDVVGLAGIEQVTIAANVAEQVEIQTKYEGYITRQQHDIAKQQRAYATALPDTIDYHQVSGLSAELIEKLTSIKPTTIDHARRIPGMTPAAISLLLLHVKKHQLRRTHHASSKTA